MDEVLEQYYYMVKPVSRVGDEFILGQYTAKQEAEKHNKKKFQETLDKEIENVLYSTYEVDRDKYRCKDGHTMMSPQAHYEYLKNKGIYRTL